MKTYEEMAQSALQRGKAMQKRSEAIHKITMRCIIAALCVVLVGTAVSAVANPDIFYQAGQFLKEALRNQHKDHAILAEYNGTAITADVVEYYRKMNILRSDEAAAERDTDLEIINRIIESMIILEEAERRGLLATEQEIAAMVDNAVKAYSLPDGKEMMDSYLNGAGITFEEYLAMLEEQAPRVIARQKLIDAVGKEYCEKNGLEFTKMNPPAEMVAAQKAFIKELFENNKHKIVYYI